MATFEDVGRMVSVLPEVAEAERHGNRTWFGARQVLSPGSVRYSKADLQRFGDTAPPSRPRSSRPRTADLADKDALLATGARGFFTIPHFEGYAAVLVQLRTATKKALREAIEDAWLACVPKALARGFLDGT